MTTVFVYEYCCALGLGRDPSDPGHSLYREGRAMRDAVAQDFQTISGVEVVTFELQPHGMTIDDVSRLPHEQRPNAQRESEISRLARTADFVLTIAPESVWSSGLRPSTAPGGRGVALTSTEDAIRLTGDKLELARLWRRRGVSTPPTRLARKWPETRLPAVWKPRNGAGSTDTYLVRTHEDVERVRGRARSHVMISSMIAQDYVTGRPASVAFLVGPTQTVPLLPTFQLLSSDGRFRYEGGELPIPPELAERSITIGRRAICCVPGLLGYVGVDLVLGEPPDGSLDYAIEINPRLTTSYVGLRQLADFNLAEAMLRVVNGDLVEPRWKPGRVRFRPDGSVSVDPTLGPASG